MTKLPAVTGYDAAGRPQRDWSCPKCGSAEFRMRWCAGDYRDPEHVLRTCQGCCHEVKWEPMDAAEEEEEEAPPKYMVVIQEGDVIVKSDGQCYRASRTGMEGWAKMDDCSAIVIGGVVHFVKEGRLDAEKEVTLASRFSLLPRQFGGAPKKLCLGDTFTRKTRRWNAGTVQGFKGEEIGWIEEEQ